MTNNKIHIFFNAIAICLVVSSCVELFDAQTEDFQDVLVIDAKLTTQAKKQQVLLNRTRPFKNFNFEAERNAQVQIIDDTGNRFAFEEYEPLESMPLNTLDLSDSPYFVKAKQCVDCRELGSNVKPVFG